MNSVPRSYSARTWKSGQSLLQWEWQHAQLWHMWGCHSFPTGRLLVTVDQTHLQIAAWGAISEHFPPRIGVHSLYPAPTQDYSQFIQSPPSCMFSTMEEAKRASTAQKGVSQLLKNLCVRHPCTHNFNLAHASSHFFYHFSPEHHHQESRPYPFIINKTFATIHDSRQIKLSFNYYVTEACVRSNMSILLHLIQFLWLKGTTQLGSICLLQWYYIGLQLTKSHLSHQFQMLTSVLLMSAPPTHTHTIRWKPY